MGRINVEDLGPPPDNFPRFAGTNSNGYDTRHWWALIWRKFANDRVKYRWAWALFGLWMGTNKNFWCRLSTRILNHAVSTDLPTHRKLKAFIRQNPDIFAWREVYLEGSRYNRKVFFFCPKFPDEKPEEVEEIPEGETSEEAKETTTPKPFYCLHRELAPRCYYAIRAGHDYKCSFPEQNEGRTPKHCPYPETMERMLGIATDE